MALLLIEVIVESEAVGNAEESIGGILPADYSVSAAARHQTETALAEAFTAGELKEREPGIYYYPRMTEDYGRFYPRGSRAGDQNEPLSLTINLYI